MKKIKSYIHMSILSLFFLIPILTELDYVCWHGAGYLILTTKSDCNFVIPPLYKLEYSPSNKDYRIAHTNPHSLERVEYLTCYEAVGIEFMPLTIRGFASFSDSCDAKAALKAFFEQEIKPNSDYK